MRRSFAQSNPARYERVLAPTLHILSKWLRDAGDVMGAFHTIKEAVVDFSQLNVRTFVGTINVEVGASGDPDWDALMKSALADGKIQLAASTTLRIDGDVDLFIDNDKINAELRQAHDDAVTAGQEAREAILSLISSKIQDLIR